jgi:hypothetical protein
MPLVSPLPHGTLSLTAGAFSGEMLLLPIVEAFLDAYPSARLRGLCGPTAEKPLRASAERLACRGPSTIR